MNARLPLIAVFVGFLPLQEARAHPDQQNAMWMQFEPTQIHMAIDVSLKELSAVWGIPEAPSPNDDTSKLRWAAEQHQTYLLEHLSLSEGKRRLFGRVVKISPPSVAGDPEKTFVQYELEYPLENASAQEVCVYHDMLKEWPYAPGTPWNIRYIVRAKRSDSDEVRSWLLSAGEPMVLSTGWIAPSSTPLTDPAPAREESFFKKTWQSVQRFFGL
jgi:hypothetical protein